jgi:hypothetical protein
MASQRIQETVSKYPPPAALNYQWPILHMVATNLHHIITEYES